MFAFAFGFIVATAIGVFVPAVPDWLLDTRDWLRERYERLKEWRGD